MSNTTNTPETDKAQLERIARATAKIHVLLKKQGHLSGLQQSAATMPDARERLNYIDNTMHEASEKVLSAVESSLPLLDNNKKTCAELSAQLANAPELAHTQLVQEAISKLGELSAADEVLRHNLMLIMEAQEFRDVAGQMVHKLFDAAMQIENILLEVLRESAPDTKDSLISKQSKTAGPAMKPSDGVSGQDEADELLASLGF